MHIRPKSWKLWLTAGKSRYWYVTTVSLSRASSDPQKARPDNAETSAAYDLVDVLTSSAQNAVHMLCESISCRTPGLSERTKKVVAFADL